MATSSHAGQPADLSELDARALTEAMTVLPDAPGMYVVVSGSGSEYVVDARGGACTCPDARYRDRTCKHQRRVAYELGERDLPDWADHSSLDAHFREFVTPSENA